MDKMTVRRLLTEMMKLPESRWDDLVVIEVAGAPFQIDGVSLELPDVVVLEA